MNFSESLMPFPLPAIAFGAICAKSFQQHLLAVAIEMCKMRIYGICERSHVYSRVLSTKNKGVRTSFSIMGKWKSKFNQKWKDNFPFLTASRKGDSYFYCTWCRCDLSCGNGGRTDVEKHTETARHQQSDRDHHQSNLKALSNFVITEDSTSSAVLAGELTLAYHTVRHHESYRSAECSVQVHKVIYPDSKIAEKSSFGATKVASLVQNVLRPASVEFILKIMAENNAFFSISSDATSRKGLRFFPLVLKFFCKSAGIQHCLLDFYEDPEETAEAVYTQIKTKLEDAGLNIQRLSSYSADSHSVNFGHRSGVHKRLTDDNPNVKKSNCLAHLIHNASDAAVNKLSSDVVGFVSKTYGHFNKSPARVQELKTFFEFVDCEWSRLLLHVTTRFLSLLPAIDRIILNWDALRSYFCSIDEDSVPPLLQKFFNIGHEEDNSMEKHYLYFLSHILKLVQETIKKSECKNITVTTIYNEMLTLVSNFEQRSTDKFYGAKMSSKLRSTSSSERSAVEKNLQEFYMTFVNYIRKRYDFSEDNYHQKLKSDFTFDQLKLACEVVNIECDEDKLFSEYTVLKEFQRSQRDSEDSVVDKYVNFFSASGASCTELQRLLSFVLSINCSNAEAERIFSLMGQVWTDDRNRLYVSSVCAELQIIVNFQGRSCVGVYADFLKNKKLLAAAKSKDKYNHHKSLDARPSN